MANGRTIEVPLSEEQLAVVAADVARGGYASPAELVQAALWEWHINHGKAHSDFESNDEFERSKQAIESELVQALHTPDITVEAAALESGLLLQHLRTELQSRRT